VLSFTVESGTSIGIRLLKVTRKPIWAMDSGRSHSRR